MKIQEHDWSKMTGVTRDYPQELFEPFLNWLMNTNVWMEDEQILHHKVNQLRGVMADERNRQEALRRERERVAAAEKKAREEHLVAVNAEADRLLAQVEV